MPLVVKSNLKLTSIYSLLISFPEKEFLVFVVSWPGSLKKFKRIIYTLDILLIETYKNCKMLIAFSHVSKNFVADIYKTKKQYILS